MNINMDECSATEKSCTIRAEFYERKRQTFGEIQAQCRLLRLFIFHDDPLVNKMEFI